MSVRKRSWKNSKGEEKEAWVVDYVDGSGKRRLKTFVKKKEAEAFHATARVEVREGTHVADSASVTVSKAGELWIEGAKAAGLERTTIAQYEQHLKFHIAPMIGGILLSKLSVPVVRNFEDRMRAEERSSIMVRKVLGSLGSILADAGERGLVARNVVRDMRGRRRRGKERQAAARQKGKLVVGVDIPTPTEIKAIVHGAKGPYRPLLLTAIFTGLRASELRGLRWTDVDLDRGELHVRQRADRFNEIGRPKSAAGERVVPLSPFILSTLREWRISYPRPHTEDRDEDGQRRREEYRQEHLVFPNGNGKVEALANIINRGLIATCLTAGITIQMGGKGASGEPILKAKYTGMHALRHFYASWCINRREEGGLGLPAKIVQERLGHSSIVMTMDIYGHLFPRGDDSEELAAAERTLLGCAQEPA